MHADIIQEDVLQKQLRAGDEQALFSLMLLYYNDLFRYALKFTAEPELTKDLVNQFFIHTWEHRNNFSSVEKMKPYIMVSFKRFLLAWYRNNPKKINTAIEGNEFIELPYEEYIISLQKEERTKKALQQAIKSLPKRQRELVQLRFYEQLTYEEISQTTSLAIRTIYNKINAALKKLRSHKLLQQLNKF